MSDPHPGPSGKPSQAEGEDPDAPQGEVLPQTGHPSQAEGEDFDEEDSGSART